MITGRAGPAVRGHHRGEVEPVDYLDDKPRQVPLGKPFIKRRRKQKRRVAIKLTEIAHRSASRQRITLRQTIARRPKSVKTSSAINCFTSVGLASQGRGNVPGKRFTNVAALLSPTGC